MLVLTELCGAEVGEISISNSRLLIEVITPATRGVNQDRRKVICVSRNEGNGAVQIDLISQQMTETMTSVGSIT